MKVLVACEESQRVCTAFRELGHEAYSCDIIEPSGGHPEWHILGDVLKILNLEDQGNNCMFIAFRTMDGKMHTLDKWDLIIAHPPCTYLSNAGACRLYPKAGQLNQERYQQGLKAKEFFLNLYSADCEYIAVENPIPSKIYEMPPYTQIIQPYEYGHPYSKKTCLWLKGLPKLNPTNTLMKYKPYCPSYTSRHKGQKDKKGVAATAKERSKTFPGIAKAMAKQWSEYIEQENKDE